MSSFTSIGARKLQVRPTYSLLIAIQTSVLPDLPLADRLFGLWLTRATNADRLLGLGLPRATNTCMYVSPLSKVRRGAQRVPIA